MGWFGDMFGKLRKGKTAQFISGHQLPISASGEIVTEATAMKIGAFYSCVALFSDIFSVVRPEMFKQAGEVEKSDFTSPLHWLLTRQPNDSQTASFFWTFALTSLQIRGAFYALISRGTSGEIKELIPVHPDKIQIVSEDIQISSGATVRKIVGFWYTSDSGSFPLDKSDMFYVFGRTLDGITPVSPIQYMADAISIASTGNTYQANAYKNGIKPSMIITVSEKLNPQAREAWGTAIRENNSGSNAGKVLVLDHGAKAENLTITPVDMDLIAASNFTINDIARFFRVDPRFLYVPSNAAGWSTVEMMSREFVNYSLLPWGDRIEDAINTQLIRYVDQGKRFASYNYDVLMKADYVGRMNAKGLMIQRGIISPNEARQEEGLAPYSGGERYYMQAQMMPVDQVGDKNGTEN